MVEVPGVLTGPIQGPIPSLLQHDRENNSPPLVTYGNLPRVPFNRTREDQPDQP